MDLSRRLRVQGQTLGELQNTSNEKLLGTRFVHTEAFHFHVITLLSLTEYGSRCFSFDELYSEVGQT